MRNCPVLLFILVIWGQASAGAINSINLARSYAEAELATEATITSARKVGDYVVYELSLPPAIVGNSTRAIFLCSTETFPVGMRILYASSSGIEYSEQCKVVHTPYTNGQFAIPIARRIVSNGGDFLALTRSEHQHLGCRSDSLVSLSLSGAAEYDWPPHFDRLFFFPLDTFKGCAGLSADEG